MELLIASTGAQVSTVWKTVAPTILHAVSRENTSYSYTPTPADYISKLYAKETFDNLHHGRLFFASFFGPGAAFGISAAQVYFWDMFF